MSALLIPSKLCLGYLVMCNIVDEYPLLRKHMVSITYSGVDQLYVKVGNFMSLDTMTDIQTSQSNNFILED